MRFISTLVLLPFFAAPALAQGDANCPTVGLLAEKIMQVRQAGAVMSDVMRMMAGDEVFNQIAVIMVKDAFSSPQWSTDENRDEAVLEFRNKYELACYTAD